MSFRVVSIAPYFMYMVNGGKLYSFVRPGVWDLQETAPANLNDVAAAPRVVVVTDTKGDLYWLNYGGTWTKDPVAKDVVSISVEADGDTVWCVNEKGELFYCPVTFANEGIQMGGWVRFAPQIGAGQQPDEKFWFYKVRLGEHLYRILRNHGVAEARLPEVAQQVKALNPQVPNIDRLQPGMTLKMPPLG